MVILFVRKLTPARKQVLEKIIEFLGLKDNNDVCDLDYFDPLSVGKIEQGVAFGEVCARLVSPNVKKLWVLPPLEKLEPIPKNNDTRAKAFEQVRNIKEELLTQVMPTTTWHTILQIGEKKVCAYHGTKPQEVEADIFISRQEYESLLRLKEAFKAEFISIVQEV